MSEAALEETNLSTTAASEPPPPPVESPALPAAEVAKPALRAAVLCGAASSLPAGYDLVVVVEGRSFVEATFDADGAQLTPATSTPVLSGYPTGAGLYYRTDPLVAFPEGSPVLTLGVDVLQWKFAGFCAHLGAVSVGPCYPAYAGANLAYQRGATAIDIIGLTAGEKERLQPWLDGVPTHAVEPAQVAVSIL